MVSDTSDQPVAAGAETPAQVIDPTNLPQTGSSPRGGGWLSRGVLYGMFAAIVVVVAGAFFTIGWFTSTRGDHVRPVPMYGLNQAMNQRAGNGPQGGTNQPGSNQPQGQLNPQRRMGAPQQGQGQNPSNRQPNQQTLTQQGYLGVGLETVTPGLQQQYGLSVSSGAVVVTIDGTGPARQAGIQQGDVITSVNGTAVTQEQDVVSSITNMKAGDSVSITINRRGQSLTFQVTLAARPASMSG
jgi:membrane-associated protease RseP (regulator of RpoE activity)